MFLAKRFFTIETLIRADISAVRAAFRSPEDFARQNPLVIAFEPVPGVADTFDITDRLRFAGIAFEMKYRARIEIFDHGVDSEVWAPLQFHQTGKIRYESANEGTVVREEIYMRTFRPFVDYSRRTGYEAHVATLAALKQRIEAGC